MKPWIHAESSAKRFGGKPEDYIDIHNLLDSSKGAIADSRHRALTHTSWFLFILEKIFGVTITTSAGRTLSVREIGEQHILEDFRGRFIPTPQDYLEGIPCQEWMISGKGEAPPSFIRIRRQKLSNKEKYLEAKKKIREAKEICDGIVKEVFTEGAMVVFDAHPRLKSFSWRQYTPYFNDGDTCTFSANADYCDVTLSGANEGDEDIELEEGWSKDAAEKEICEAVQAFLGEFDDDDFYDMFDDHVKVTVTREGTEVSECEHD